MTPELWVTLLSGGIAGAILQPVLKFINNRKGMTLTNEQILREELQEQLDAMKIEIKELRGEVNVWKQKYFELYEEHLELKTKLK